MNDEFRWTELERGLEVDAHYIALALARLGENPDPATPPTRLTDN